MLSREKLTGKLLFHTGANILSESFTMISYHLLMTKLIISEDITHNTDIDPTPVILLILIYLE
jgi:hypothetical protein